MDTAAEEFQIKNFAVSVGFFPPSFNKVICGLQFRGFSTKDRFKDSTVTTVSLQGAFMGHGGLWCHFRVFRSYSRLVRLEG